MAKDIEIQINRRQMRSAMRLLARVPNGWPRAASRAVNRTARRARTWIVRQISSETKLRQTDVRKAIILRRASYRLLEAHLLISGGRIPLIRLGARQTKKGVTYRDWRQPGRKLLRGRYFIQTMPSGHRGVFWRKYRRDPEYIKQKKQHGLPIFEELGPSIQGIYEGAAGLAGRMMAETQKQLHHELDTQVRVLLEKAGRR